MKIYQIEDEIYKQNFAIITDISLCNLKKYINKKFPGGKLEVDNMTIGCYFYAEKDDLRYYFLWIPKIDWTIQQQGILTHELIHHLTETFKIKGIEMSEANTEVMAYYWDYIFIKVWRIMNKHIKRKK